MSILTKARRLLSRKTKPEQPVTSRDLIYFRTGEIAAPFTHEQAFTYSVFWSCIRVISETFGCLPWNVLKERADGGADRIPGHFIARMLAVRPNPEMTASVFWQTLIAWRCVYGNGYAEIERNGDGTKPQALWPIHPDRVRVNRDPKDNRIVYEVRSLGGGQASIIEAPDMLHLKGMGYDGLVGYSMVQMASRALGIGIAMDSFIAAFFANGAWMGGLIEPAGVLSPEQVKELRESWEARHKGARNAFKPGILPFGAKWHSTSSTNQDAQMDESRRAQVLEICRFCRVPPHKVYELGRATWNNIGEQKIEFVDDHMSLVRGMEEEADAKLLGNGSDGVYTKININGLLRGDPERRGSFYKVMWGLGAFSANRILALEDENPIGPDGDKRYVPVNTIPVDAVDDFWAAKSPADLKDDTFNEGDGDDEKEESPDAEPEAEEPAEDSGELRKLAEFTTREFLRESVERLVRKEAYAARDAIKKAGADRAAFDEAMAGFLEKHEAELAERLAKPVSAWRRLHGADPKGYAADVALEYRIWLAAELADAYGPEVESRLLAGAERRIDYVCGRVTNALDVG